MQSRIRPGKKLPGISRDIAKKQNTAAQQATVVFS
jgi:hypothetical protein